METTNENIRQLIEMLDNPDAYTEQEIRDIINRDEDTRETYRLMVEAKRSSRHRQSHHPADVDAAWQSFVGKKRKNGSMEKLKIAASVIGILFVSGIAFATIHIMRSTGGHQESPAQEEQIATPVMPVTPSDTLATDTTALQPITFDNIPLDEMLTKIAAYYHTEVVFQSDEARSLRFYFVWYREQPLSKVVETLNRFESISIEMTDQKLIVR